MRMNGLESSKKSSDDEDSSEMSGRGKKGDGDEATHINEIVRCVQ